MRQGDEIVDGEGRGLHGKRLVFREIAAEVSRQRGQVRDVALPTSIDSARAAGSVDVQGHMPEFTGHIVLPAQKLSLDDHADAESVGDAHEDEIFGRLGAPACSPQLGKGAGPSGVLDGNRKAECRFERLEEREIVPSQTRCEEDAASGAIDHARHDDADPGAFAELFMVGERSTDPHGQLLHESFRIALCGEAADAHQRPSDEVGHHEIGAASPYVDSHRAAGAGFDEEELRFPPARRLAGGPFEDDSLFDELVDEKAHGSAAHVHGAGKLGTGDGARPDEIEDDLAVDLSGRSAGGNAEVVWIDPSHGFVSSGQNRLESVYLAVVETNLRARPPCSQAKVLDMACF